MSSFERLRRLGIDPTLEDRDPEELARQLAELDRLMEAETRRRNAVYDRRIAQELPPSED